MKTKLNWLTVTSLLLLLFCISYLLSRLIKLELYIDALFVAAIAVLFPLLVYFLRKGK